jgi:tetratricopeptide (TPR) repeat protein
MDLERSRRQQAVRRAEGYLELGMYEHALEAAQMPEALDEFEGHVSYLRGEALRSLERHAEALVEFHRAADAMPEDVHVLLAMGWCYKRCDQLDLAIRSLEKALALETHEGLTLYNLACYWSLAGNKDRALRYLADAFEVDPDYRYMVDDEEDFDPVRHEPEFLALTSVIV